MTATAGKLTALAVAFTRHGITDRADRLRLCTEHAGRHIWSSKALTVAEVDGLLDRLEHLPAGTLPSHAVRLRHEEEAAARH